MNTVRDRAAPVDKPAANAHTHPDVADFPRRRRTLPPLLADRLETMAFRTAYDMYAKAGYQGEISADWLAVRLNGYARTHFGSETPDYAYILQLCTHVAHETVYGRNVTPERRIQSRSAGAGRTATRPPAPVGSRPQTPGPSGTRALSPPGPAAKRSRRPRSRSAYPSVRSRRWPRPPPSPPGRRGRCLSPLPSQTILKLTLKI